MRNSSRYRLRRFEILVELALERLPQFLKDRMTNVIIEVADEPDDETLRDLGIDPATCDPDDHPYGLYEPLSAELDAVGLMPQVDPPYRIVIFAKPLARDFPGRKQLMIEIRKTVVHEVMHHFGCTDEDMEAFDDHPNPFGEE